ncbi:MAG: proteasome accessory factor PafA2 family protein, partial [Enhygromyxa sp.]
MLDRLLGLETEYAIRWTLDASREVSGDTAGARPPHDLVHTGITTALARRQATRSGARETLHKQLFLQNGGAIYYEFLPHAPSEGLIEASTPECRGPSELLLYQKAQEQMLLEVLPEANAWLRAQGYAGELGLLKNCRDAEGHVYGAQENYEVELASGLSLWAYRIGLALLLPGVLLSGALVLAVSFAWIAVLMVGFVLALIVLFVVALARPRRAEAIERLLDDGDRMLRPLMRSLNAIGMTGTAPGVLAYALLYRSFCCRRIRHDALGFLISRPILSGAGSLDPVTGEFGLSEKGPVMRRLVRITSMPVDRSVFDIGHLVKPLFSITNFELRPLAGLFRRRQRLQLGLSDSNLAHTAEYLKVATTNLVFDMAEAGALRGLPRVRRPIAALRRLIADPELEVKVRCSDGVMRSAIELQRIYLERAREFVAGSAAVSLEARELVRLWAEVLDALEREPASLFGRLDWVTKRGLLAGAGSGEAQLDSDAQKKLDLKYHELGVGYLAQLEREGLAPTLVDAEEVARAKTTPPQDSPARRRSQLVQALAAEGVRAQVSWDRVEIRR